MHVIKTEILKSSIPGIPDTASWDWFASAEAGRLCREAGVSAKDGLGKVFAIEGTTRRVDINAVLRKVEESRKYGG